MWVPLAQFGREQPTRNWRLSTSERLLLPFPLSSEQGLMDVSYALLFNHNFLQVKTKSLIFDCGIVEKQHMFSLKQHLMIEEKG
jgi:hypothetical protein